MSYFGLKLIYLYPWKPYEADFRNKSVSELNARIRGRLETINKVERRWIVIIAGVGFFADAYSIFSINMVLPMLGIVYWKGNIPPAYELGLNIATLGGSLLGQLFFGIAADKLGRRKMYGWELLVTIAATIGVATSSRGEDGSLSLYGGLIAWRFILGLGIGSDYPLSAVICSEFAPTKNRARMLSAVFLFQPLGQLISTLVALIVTAAFSGNSSLYTQSGACYSSSDCRRAVDIMWRIIIGLGAVPPALAFGFRLAILESLRYTADVLNDRVKAAAQGTLMGRDIPTGQAQRPAFTSALESSGLLPREESVARSQGEDILTLEPLEELEMEEFPPVEASDNISRDRTAPVDSEAVHNQAASTHIEPNSDTESISSSSSPEQIPPMRRGPDPLLPKEWNPSERWKDIKKYYWEFGHIQTLFAASICWFCVDLPFYGLGMNNFSTVGTIWSGSPSLSTDAYHLLLNNAWQGVVVVSIGSVLGAVITFFTIKLLGERRIQMNGFFWLFILFVVTGGAFKSLMDNGRSSAIVVFYIFCQIFFNWGPNATTYIIPAEFFPTRYRASSYGIAAASGKFGSVIAQLIVFFVTQAFGGPKDIYLQNWLGVLLVCFSPFMLIGLAATYFLIPQTRGPGGPLTLEVLAAEDGRPINRFDRIWQRMVKNQTVNCNGNQGEDGRPAPPNEATSNATRN